MNISRRKVLKMLAATAPAALLGRAYGQADSADTAAKAAGATPAGGTATSSTTAPMRPIPPAPAYIAPPAGFGVAPGRSNPIGNRSRPVIKSPIGIATPNSASGRTGARNVSPRWVTGTASSMYQQKNPLFKWHAEHYGPQAEFGFKDVINQWKAEHWDPVHLINVYKKAGAKFFAAMANHHDNTDMFDSTYQPWNSTKVGPEERHRRRMDESRTRCGSALRRLLSWRPCLELVSGRPAIRWPND